MSDPAPAKSDLPSRRPTVMARFRRRLSGLFEAAAPYVVAIDGVVLILLGGIALLGSRDAVQGEGLVLALGGLALVLFGVMMIARWNLSAVRTGLFGFTAGYFAVALAEFEVATDPCDIGATLARCTDDLVMGSPWIVYQAPVILAALLFVFVVFEPFLEAD